MKLAAREVFVPGSIEVYDARIDDYVVIEAERVHARVRAYWGREARRSIDG